MTQVVDKATEHTRVRESRDDCEAGGIGGVPWEYRQLFARLFIDDGGDHGARATMSGTKEISGVAMITALTEQLVPRVMAGSQWPLQAVLYLPRLGRINASVRREQNAWGIELDAEQDTTARWLSGVSQACELQLARALGQPVSLRLPHVGNA